ncbi:MAG TPA: hypothetical protein VKA76_15525 [Gammaproteobacteria bacterium]|nr:hypothetical protein [Gammaproteobacteria bacterium]
MFMREQSKQNIEVVVDAKEAQHILEGLERFHDSLDETGQELERQLKAAGVAPPAKPDHIRYEYAPPLD